MSDDLGDIAALATALLRKVGPAERRRLLRTIAADVRRAQADRIAAQVQPDGTPFAPRREKPQSNARARRGAIRRQAMFRRLRLARHLAAGATPDEAWTGFAGRAARIARVHQEGLADAPAPGQAQVRYARRILLGLSDADRTRILDLLLAGIEV